MKFFNEKLEVKTISKTNFEEYIRPKYFLPQASLRKMVLNSARSFRAEAVTKRVNTTRGICVRSGAANRAVFTSFAKGAGSAPGAFICCNGGDGQLA